MECCIRQKAGISNNFTFYKFQLVADELVVTLLQTAQEITGNRTIKLKNNFKLNAGVSKEEILEGAGKVFYETCHKTGHSLLLNTLAVDLKTFLQSLDSLHAYLTVSFKKMRAPSFTCESGQNGSILLKYYSQRKGLEYLVIGIVKAAAKAIYHSDITLEVLSKKDDQWGENNNYISFAVKGTMPYVWFTNTHF